MYLQASKLKSNSIVKDGNNSPAAIQESSNVEITALRSIMKCVEICNLESKFNTTELKRQLAVLEKAKANRKKHAVSKKSRSKRPRSIGATAPFRHAKAARTSNMPYVSHQPIIPKAYQLRVNQI